MIQRGPRRHPITLPGGAGHRVTTLELFFDLVFVFAFTQVTALVASSGDLTSAVRGLVLAALLWWIWCSYSWLGNQARADEGVLRHALFLAMAAVTVLALAIPQAWTDGHRDAAAVLVACTVIVQWIHLGVYALAAGADRGLLRQLALVAGPVLAGNVLLAAGAVAGPGPRTWWWGAGMLVNYTGIYVAGATGWRLPSPGHFAERYSLIVLIALGESVVAIGVGLGGVAPTPAVIAATVIAIALSASLWWLYFDVLALVVEHHLVSAPSGRDQTALARDALTFLHFPVVVSVLGLAVGIKKVFAALNGHASEPLTHALHPLPAVLVAGGAATYVVAVCLLHRRIAGRLDRPALIAAALLVVLAALAGTGVLDGRLPALGYLLVVSAVMISLVVVVAWSQHDLRHRYRYEGLPHRS
jgi:low temperature requirement protein LtrA